MYIDIIIVNYCSADCLIKCLESIYDSLEDLPANVFVHDNSPYDDLTRIRPFFPKVKITGNLHNIGFAAAVNKTLKKITAPFALILNPDSVIKKDFFKSVLNYMETNPQVGIVGPEVLNKDGSVQASARSFPTPVTIWFGRSSLLTRFFPNNSFTRANILSTNNDGKTPVDVDWVSGACMLVRKKAIADVGLMDEQFFMYWEDVDWCRRFGQKGWKVVYFPRASVIHYIGVSSKVKPVQTIIEFHKSLYKIINKYINPYLRFTHSFLIGALALRMYFSVSLNIKGRLIKTISLILQQKKK